VVGEAEDAKSAVAAVQELCPDVVLLDVLLRDTNGFEIVDQLAARSLVVLVSSREERAFRQQLAGSAACGFVYKANLSLRTLDDLLERWA
jgi:DNA-binding NarL/FixJ family response regulator